MMKSRHVIGFFEVLPVDLRHERPVIRSCDVLLFYQTEQAVRQAVDFPVI